MRPLVGGLNREFCNNLYFIKIRLRVKAEKQETNGINIKMARQNSQNILV